MQPRTANVLALTCWLAGILPAAPAVSAPSRKPPRRSPPARTGPRPAPRPAPNPAPAATPLTAGSLPAGLRSAGYQPRAQGQFQRLQIEDDSYVYAIDVGLSGTGDWLVCLAHLAPLPDLTQVPSAPLLSLLSRNDALLGMYFSYNRENGRIMLNAAVPNRQLTPPSLRSLVEGVKRTVKATEGLWNTRAWAGPAAGPAE